MSTCAFVWEKHDACAGNEWDSSGLWANVQGHPDVFTGLLTFAHNPLESHSFPAHASCFSHTNAQVLIPCHCFSVAALGLNPHAHYLSPVTITRHRHPSPNSLSPMSNPLLLAAKPLLPVKGAETLHLSPSPSLPEFVIAAMS